MYHQISLLVLCICHLSLVCCQIQASQLVLEVMGTTPEIFIIGAAKCATTSLHDLLSQHTDICNSNQKEKHFFDVPKTTFRVDISSIRRYKEMFPSKRSSNCKHNIDSTPSYIRGTAIDNMVSFFPQEQFRQKKFILILRDPTARECSWFQHFARGCLSHIKDRIAKLKNRRILGGKIYNWTRSQLCAGSNHGYCEALGCLERNNTIGSIHDHDLLDSFAQYFVKSGGNYSKYDEQLTHWLQFVDRDHILILSMTDVVKKTPLVINAITKFLGIANTFGSHIRLPKKNINHWKSLIPSCDCNTFDKFKNLYDRLGTVTNTMNIINSSAKHNAEPPFRGMEYVRQCDK